jgi:hypothetical protein
MDMNPASISKRQLNEAGTALAKLDRPNIGGHRMTIDPNEFSAIVKVRAGKVYPDLVNSLALRNLPKEMAAAEGWPTYYMPEPCANGHTSARYVANDLCTDCWRQRQGREVLYPAAKNRKYYKQRDPAVTTANPVIVAPAAPPAPPEPSKVEQKFLAALDETRDFDAAAAAVNWTRGLVESRASSNPVFKSALTDLCERRGIARTRAPDSIFTWSEEIERNLLRRFVDTGLLETARNEVGCAASDYFAHLEKSPTFAALVSAAESRARETLRDRSYQAAERGNDHLLKILEKDAKPASNLTLEQAHAELQRLLDGFVARGIIKIDHVYRHVKTGAQIDLREYEPVDGSNADLVS